MKTKIATILAVALFLAVLSISGTNAQRIGPYSTAPAAPVGTTIAVMMPPPGQPGFESNRGKITRLYTDRDGIYFRLGGRPAEFQNAMNPTNGYYFIPMTHPNYHAMRDLLHAVAVNGLNLKAQTEPNLGRGGRADVIYLVQDF